MGKDERLAEKVAALRKSEDFYKRMIAEIQDYAIIRLDKDGFIQNWNKGAERIKLYSENEIVGRHFSLFYLLEDQRKGLPQRLMNEARAKGRVVHEGWRARKDETRFWGSVTITAVHDDHGQVIGFSKVTRDLTARKDAEDYLKRVTEELRQKNEKLRLSEEIYHRMIAEIQEYAIILLNLNGDVENWNAGAEAIKGYSSEVIGRNFRIFYTEEDRATGLPELLLETARKAGKSSQEGWRVRKDGSRFWGSTVITALHNAAGDLVGYSKVTRDLSEKKIADEKMLQYTHELEVQNKELEQFAYVASHDLQEPLRKIRTFSDLIERDPSDQTSVSKYLERIKSSAKRMSELIESILRYGRLNREEVELSDVDLNETVAEVVDDFELLIEEKRAVINHGILPVIKGNADQLGQLFANLLSNALKFSHGDPVVSIGSSVVSRRQVIDSPEFLPEGDYYEVTVSDNGIGFDQKYEKLVFTIFQRLHGKQEYPGTGIGLALCRRVMEIHKGHIAVRSEPGAGSTFYLYLPVGKRMHPFSNLN